MRALANGEYPVKDESLNVNALEQEFSKFVPRNHIIMLFKFKFQRDFYNRTLI